MRKAKTPNGATEWFWSAREIIGGFRHPCRGFGNLVREPGAPLRALIRCASGTRREEARFRGRQGMLAGADRSAVILLRRATAEKLDRRYRRSGPLQNKMNDFRRGARWQREPVADAVGDDEVAVEAPHTTGTKEHNVKSKANHVVPFVNLRDLCVRSLWRRCRETATERRRYRFALKRRRGRGACGL
jgi:hypothetical protein